jgi:hypothetical protein
MNAIAARPAVQKGLQMPARAQDQNKTVEMARKMLA